MHEGLSRGDLPALKACPKFVHRVLVIPHALPESLNVHQDSLVRVDTFEGVCDVVEYVQIFDNRADLRLPHVTPAGREGEEVARSHDRGIRVCQAFHPRKDLIPRARRCLAERRKEPRRPVLSDPSANLDAFGSGTLVARRQSDRVVTYADEHGKHALNLCLLALQGRPLLGDLRHLLTPRAPQTGAAPQHSDSAQRHDPAGPIRPAHSLPHPVMGLVIDGAGQLKGSHQQEKETKNEAQKSTHRTAGPTR